MRIVKRAAVLAIALMLGACNAETDIATPDPVEPTREAIGHYCRMILVDHEGPKAQIHLKSAAEPVWFSSVRDGFAYRMLPGEPKDVAAFYVNDMGAAKTWATPEAGTWIDAQKAHFVIGSSRRGGMGQQEAVPFGTDVAANAFAKEFGGTVVPYDEVPRTYILKEAVADSDRGSHHHHGEHGSDAKDGASKGAGQ